MIIGIDFDNTLACYDDAIQKLSYNGFGIPEGIQRTKLGIRNYLRSVGREESWIEFQGLLYGPGMRDARPFEGCLEGLEALCSAGHTLYIVSHRSKKPYAGPPYDLHDFAKSWIRDNIDIKRLFGCGENIFFNETKDGKLEMIKKLNCNVFIDDLPEVIESIASNCQHKFLFSPNQKIEGMHKDSVSSWSDFTARVLRI